MFRINLYKFSLQKFFSLIILQWNCWLKWVLANCNDWMITLFWLLIRSIKYWRKIKEARKSLKLKLDYINPFNKIYIVYVTQATIMNLFTSYSFKICSVVWRYSGTYKLALIAKKILAGILVKAAWIYFYYIDLIFYDKITIWTFKYSL